MSWIAGVDGCRDGWIAGLRSTVTGELTTEMVRTLRELLESHYLPELVVVDIPIGLPDSGARLCDQAARVLLKRRASSIFPAPVRPVLHLRDYRAANRLTRTVCGKGLTLQTYNFLPKITETDSTVRAAARGQVREGHPELAFLALNRGTPLTHSKKCLAGRLERRSLLESMYGSDLARLEARRRVQAGVADDLYDALAVLETSARLMRGETCRIPDPVPVDSAGLPMEILFFPWLAVHWP